MVTAEKKSCTMLAVREWVKENSPNDKLIYKDGLYKQVCVVEQIAAQLLSGIRLDEDTAYKQYKNLIKVISTHTSKSVRLPVYFIVWRDIEFIIRYNFHNWIVSVHKLHTRPDDFEGVIDEKKIINAVYAEGFPERYVFGSYAKDKYSFTCEFWDQYEVMFFFRKIWYAVTKNDVKVSEVIQSVLNATPAEFLAEESMGTSYGESIKKEVHTWHYLSTLLSLMLRYNKKARIEVKRRVYIAAFNCIPEWLQKESYVK